jgi:hypothetical protein
LINSLWARRHRPGHQPRARWQSASTAHHDTSERALAAAVKAHVDVHIKHSVTVNATKSSLFNKEVTVLGHRVSHNHIAPIRERVLELQNIEAPSTRSDLGSLLAVFRWYAKCIPNLSELTAPLSDLMSTKVSFKWLRQHDDALERLKEALLRYVVRSAPVEGVPFIVSTDASGQAVSYSSKSSTTRRALSRAAAGSSPRPSRTTLCLARKC